MKVYKCHKFAEGWRLLTGELVDLEDGTRIVAYKARLHHLSAEGYHVDVYVELWKATKEEAWIVPLQDSRNRHYAEVEEIEKLMLQ